MQIAEEENWREEDLGQHRRHLVEDEYDSAPNIHDSQEDYNPLYSSFDSHLGDDYIYADRDNLPYGSRVSEAMSDFNGKSDILVTIFLFEDFLVTNTMLYLLWFGYIPITDGSLFDKEDF